MVLNFDRNYRKLLNANGVYVKVKEISKKCVSCMLKDSLI